MPDIFNRQTDQYGGSFTPEGLLINFTGNAQGVNNNLVAAGLVIQAIGWNYAQRATLLFEIGSPRSYFVGGRTEGQVTLQRVTGPKTLGAAFILAFGDICNVEKNSLSISALNQCAAGNNAERENYTLKFCLLTNLAFNVNANDSLMQQTLNMMFASCSM